MRIFTNCLNYLGHVNSSQRPEVWAQTTDAICEPKHTTTVTQLQSFSGLCEAYAALCCILAAFPPRWFKSFVKVNCRPLTDQPTIELPGGRREQEICGTCAGSFTFTSQLYSTYRRCNKKNGFVLLQEQLDGADRSIGYFYARSLTPRDHMLRHTANVLQCDGQHQFCALSWRDICYPSTMITKCSDEFSTCSALKESCLVGDYEYQVSDSKLLSALL